jgi:hypothetical protein
MKKISILLLAITGSVSVLAQSVKLPAGKKFGVTIVTQMTTKASAMGQEMELGNTFTNMLAYELKAVTANGYTLSSTLKRIKSSISVMGQEESFDSDDEASRTNPMLTEAFAALNKPFEIEVENKKVLIKGQIGGQIDQMGIPGVSNEQVRFILTQQDMVKLKDGNQWKDSSITDGGKTVNEYTVLKTTDATAELLVKTIMQVNLTLNQAGMEVKQAMQGTANARRQYNKVTGLLMKEDSDVAMSGTMEMMGQVSPVNIKGKITTTVNE